MRKVLKLRVKNCAKESIASLSKESSLSQFGKTGVLFGRETVEVVLIVFDLLSVGNARILRKRKNFHIWWVYL